MELEWKIPELWKITFQTQETFGAPKTHEQGTSPILTIGNEDIDNTTQSQW